MLVSGSTIVRGPGDSVASSFTSSVVAHLPLLELASVGPVTFLLFLFEIPALRHDCEVVPSSLVLFKQTNRLRGKGNRPPFALVDLLYRGYVGRE